ncbi:MAG: leucyl/phenylalanyl-tRNA--protein transferase [Planctomycetes bacterium]|nr:leucyl/phenylalanyl-tRNA--protein transferase [Planctomycetota bacterium]
MDVLRALVSQLQRHRTLPLAPPFPAPASADERGCVAISTELTPELVLEAYRAGIFPMVEPDGSFGWWSPDPRATLDLHELYVSRRLERRIRSARFEIRIDTAFEAVIRACAAREETWISPDVIEVYCELFRRGITHSVEAWRGGRLVGGLYGVSLGSAFMAESMFHHETDAGKVTVVALVERLRDRDYTLCDVQYITRATSVFEPIELPRERYLFRLGEALANERSFA